MTILGWEHPLISPESTGREAELIVIPEGSPVERHVKLKRNLSRHGLILDHVNCRIDDVAGRPGWYAPVITTNVSLESEFPSPKKYLILQSLSGDGRAFYSDVPNPPLR